MITLPELRTKALNRYLGVLRAHLTGEELFPLALPVNKALDRRHGADHIHAQQAELLQHSKNKTGHGYWLTVKPNAKTGQSEISRVVFETQADYLSFVSKADEFGQFAAHAARTAAFPALLPLLAETPRLLLDHAADWPDLLTVCAYFEQNPQPNQYVRNLPLGLPTKFVEQHQAALRPLLNRLIPAHIRADEDDFFRRFHLLLDEPGIRLRFLDTAHRLHPAVSQCVLWASEFRELDLPVRRVFIIENLTTFRSLPLLADSLAIWGGGFAVSLLAGSAWLADKQLFYWGDIDVHGFQILAQLRAHYPAVQSVLMDEATLRRYHGGGRGGTFAAQALSALTAPEQHLYQELLGTNARLEQEKLPVAYVEQVLRELTTA